MMDTVHRLLQYVENFPPEAGALELKNQLSAFTHHDLRAACRRLKLSVSNRQNKKGGFISVLVSYWKASKIITQVAQTPSELQSKSGIEVPFDVAQFVQLFPPHGHVEELQSRLNACRSRTLRSACVVLGLQPKKSFTKTEFLRLLVTYWQDSSVIVSQFEEPHVTPPQEEEVEVVHTKRPRLEEERDVTKTLQKKKKKKNKALERSESFIEDNTGAMTASLEKARVVKEWASAIEILSRVDGSAESIASIRQLIAGVVDSATSEL